MELTLQQLVSVFDRRGGRLFPVALENRLRLI
jgi:hypothetical protein